MATFIIEDTTDPVLNIPDALTLECDNVLNDQIIENFLLQANASDDCGEVTVTNNSTSVFVAGCGMTGIFTVTFTATDECTNTITADQTITIIDTTSPTITTC